MIDPDPPSLGTSNDTVTETEHRSFGSKIGSSLMGMILAPVLLVGSVVGMFWNEGRAVITSRSLTEGAGQVMTVDPARVAAEHDGKLVYLTGAPLTRAQLRDEEFDIVTKGVILRRAVEMYQWKEESRSETRKNLGGSEDKVTTYTYARVWADQRNDSDKFRQPQQHSNPEMRYRPRSVVAQDATLGAFQLREPALRKLSGGRDLRVDPTVLAALRARVSGGQVHVVDGRIYIGADPGNPTIGDLRVSFTLIDPDRISVVGKQSGTTIEAYKAKAGDELLFVRSGTVAAADIFAAAQAGNTTLTWILRAVTAVVMLIGFWMLAAPLAALGDVIPAVGSVIGAASGFIAVILTAVVAPVVIAIAWFWHRPLVSLAVLAGGAILAFLARKLAPARAPVRGPAIATTAARPGPSFLPPSPPRR